MSCEIKQTEFKKGESASDCRESLQTKMKKAGLSAIDIDVLNRLPASLECIERIVDDLISKKKINR